MIKGLGKLESNAGSVRVMVKEVSEKNFLKVVFRWRQFPERDPESISPEEVLSFRVSLN